MEGVDFGDDEDDEDDEVNEEDGEGEVFERDETVMFSVSIRLASDLRLPT